MTIPIEEADELLYREGTVRQEVSKHRWYTKTLVVYPFGDTFRGFYYLDPATEDQEGQDTYETDPVETFPVVPYEKKIIVWYKYDEVPA